MSIQRRHLGAQGEEYVIQHLRSLGFVLLAQNYSQHQGEIDIIAMQSDLVIFVEVKLRRTSYFPLSQLIPLSKQKKIVKTAIFYILSNKLVNKIFRFDVALLAVDKANNYAMTYIDNAFTASLYESSLLI